MKALFTRSKPYVVLAVFWVFIGAYFFDAANLDDLLPDTVVLHPEANDSAPDGSTLGFSTYGNAAPKPDSQAHQDKPSANSHTVKIVIDQDSPSLAPEPLLSMATTNPCPEFPDRIADSFTSSSSLYLLNCTFLI